MRLSKWTYLAALLPSVLGCGETTYDLYEQVDAGLGTSSGGNSGTGGAMNSAPTTGGNVGLGGSFPTGDPPRCQATRDANLTLVRLVAIDRDLCLTQGPATVFFDSPGYETTLSPCAEDPSQYWTVIGLSDGSWELRNEGSAMNLDINYGYTASGTPVVLFTPHRQDNQRFFIIPGASDSFLLAPYNARWQCIEARDDGAVEIWPCEAETLAQNFRQISCFDGE